VESGLEKDYSGGGWRPRNVGVSKFPAVIAFAAASAEEDLPVPPVPKVA
jgi:hypothetical protein